MLLEHYHKARGTSLEVDGRVWYQTARAECRHLAIEYGTDVQMVAGIVAALSPRIQWANNLRQADNALAGRPVKALGNSVRNAARIIAGESPETVLRGPKTRAFWRALCGDPDAVVLDVWMLRAFGHDRDTVTPYQYRLFSETVRQLAWSVGETPAVFQAIVWCAIRRKGN